MTEDPERLLRRLRATPNPAFLRQLKSRLDAQTPGPRPSSWLWRALWIGVAGAAWAVTFSLRILPGAAPEAPAEVSRPSVASSSQGPSVSSILVQQTRTAPAHSPLTVASGITATSQVAKTQEDPSPGAQETVAGSASSSAGGGTFPGTASIFGSRALAPYVRMIGFSDAATALARICTPGEPNPPDFAASDRRINEAEQRRCLNPDGSGGVEEAVLGHEVTFLARSRLYGPLPLTMRAVFLALARQVPDPLRPQVLIPNPYHVWSEIDSSLPPDPIRVLGPAESDSPGSMLLEVLLLGGCHQVLPADAPCPGVRSDGVYTGMSEFRVQLLRELQINPTYLGVLDLDALTWMREEVAVSPLDAVVPKADTVLSGAYPAARGLYLYANSRRVRGYPLVSMALARYRELGELGDRFGRTRGALVSRQALQRALPSP